MAAILGTTTDNHPLFIGDTERPSGLYILGKPRMGKSWLMINLAVQDARDEDHGIFFIDPHGEAVEELLNQIRPDCSSYKKNLRYLLIDPTEKDYTFTINPLECITGTPAFRSSAIHDPVSRSYAFARTKGIFDKLWKNTFEEKPWLQLILQNTIYVFIENKGFTIVDFPLFFSMTIFAIIYCPTCAMIARHRGKRRSGSCRASQRRMFFWKSFSKKQESEKVINLDT